MEIVATGQISKFPGTPARTGLEAVLLQVSPVHGEMAAELIRSSESFGAVGPGAGVRLLTRVCTHVRFEMVRTGELPLTDIALEGAHAGVLPAVSTQLVGAGEPLSAPLVVAHVRFLTRVLADVHLEMGELQVALGAAWVEANEGFSLLLGLGHDALSIDELRALLSQLRDDKGRL